MTRLLPILWCVVGSTVLAAQQASTTVHRNLPERLDFSDALVARLQVPDGFRVSVFARGLDDPRMMQVASDGTVYVTRWRSDDILALRDTDGDGVADRRVVLGTLEGAHGLELVEPYLVVASPREVWAATVQGDRVLTPPVRLIAGLPDGGQHENRTVRYGADGLLYVSVGSSCNDCVEENQRERGTLIRYTPGGQRVDVYAKGLRNTIGFDWHPDTGVLWGMDNGNDFHGDDAPPEELNRLQPGRHYGWPLCYGARIVDELTNDPPRLESLQPGEQQPVGTPTTRDAFCAQTEPSVLTYTAHAAPLAMVFRRGSEWPGYRGDAFVTFRGSWNRSTPVGYKVSRLRFDNGRPVGFEDFLTGFLSDDGTNYFGRPTGLAIAPDGSMLVSDDENGIIYRVARSVAVAR
jgi:glucose/arabinose dehydrogenase